jgi:hypothetical protein
MRLTYIVGTRPNFVKMAPVIARLRERRQFLVRRRRADRDVAPPLLV